MAALMATTRVQADEAGVVGPVAGVELEQEVVVHEVEGAGAAAHEARDDPAAVDLLEAVGDHAVLDEVDETVGEHLGVHAEVVLACRARTASGIPPMPSCSVEPSSTRSATISPMRRSASPPPPHLPERAVDEQEGVDPVERHDGVAVRARHPLVDLREDDARRVGGRRPRRRRCRACSCRGGRAGRATGRHKMEHPALRSPMETAMKFMKSYLATAWSPHRRRRSPPTSPAQARPLSFPCCRNGRTPTRRIPAPAELPVDRFGRRHQADPGQDRDLRCHRRPAEGRSARKGRSRAVADDHGRDRSGRKYRRRQGRRHGTGRRHPGQHLPRHDHQMG